MAVAITSIRLSTPAGRGPVREHAAGVGRKQQLQRNPLSAGIIRGVMVRVDVRFLERDAGLAKRFLGLAGHGQRQIEDADDGRALRTTEMGGSATDDVGGHAALAVCRAGQRNQRRTPGDEITDLGGVADRENVPVARAHLIVNSDAAGRTDLQAGLAGQIACRAARPRTESPVRPQIARRAGPQR